MVRVAVATSIAPFRHDVQRAAVRSWLDLGFEVSSFNDPTEADSGVPYPDVRFVGASRSYEFAPGRRVVHVHDAVQCLLATNADVLALVNSDIELAGTASFPGRLAEWCGDGLVFGARADVDAPGQRRGPMLPHGFDYFFLSRRAASAVQDLGFCFGMPWWDYAVPFLALARGLPVRRFARPVGFHVKHPMAWSAAPWHELGRRFVRHVRGMTDYDPQVERVVAMARATPWKLQEIGQQIVRTLLERCAAVDPGGVADGQ